MRRIERRAAPRVPVPLPLHLDDAQGKFTARTKNLSASGAYCMLRRFLAPMTKLAMQLELPGRPVHWVRCEGIVVRVEPARRVPRRSHYYVAIFFSEIAETDRSRIADYVQRVAARRAA